MPGAESRKRRRRYRKRPKEERDADEAIARLYALDRAERIGDLDARRLSKMARFAAAYGVGPGTLVALDGRDYAVTRVVHRSTSSGPLETELDLREVPKARTILGARVDFLIIDDVMEPKK